MEGFDNNFLNTDNYIDCINRGAEVEFIYNKKPYSIIHYDGKVLIGEVGHDESDAFFENASDSLDYKLQGKRLRDILDDMQITFRSL